MRRANYESSSLYKWPIGAMCQFDNMFAGETPRLVKTSKYGYQLILELNNEKVTNV